MLSELLKIGASKSTPEIEKIKKDSQNQIDEKKDDEKLQQIDLAAIVTTLTKGMQELIDKVNVLESELAVLKGN